MGALRWVAALSLGAGLTLAACGGDDDDSASGGATTATDVQTVSVKATDALKFEPDALTATAGVIHIVLDNAGATTHTFVIDGQDFKLTDDDSGDVDLAAGDFTFYCDIPGHRSAGMEGTLTVNG
jgi:uncharacterized cupredoxin-like copper-binding protein